MNAPRRWWVSAYAFVWRNEMSLPGLGVHRVERQQLAGAELIRLGDARARTESVVGRVADADLERASGRPSQRRRWWGRVRRRCIAGRGARRIVVGVRDSRAQREQEAKLREHFAPVTGAAVAALPSERCALRPSR